MDCVTDLELELGRKGGTIGPPACSTFGLASCDKVTVGWSQSLLSGALDEWEVCAMGGYDANGIESEVPDVSLVARDTNVAGMGRE